MNEEILIPMDRNLARQLFEALKRPAKDREGHTIYAINLNMALDIRMALGPVLEGK